MLEEVGIESVEGSSGFRSGEDPASLQVICIGG